jgi:phage repressor protein C with HTH and peptisase S24 domain
MLRVLRVTGNSLLPVYQDGDFVLVSKIPYLFSTTRKGDIIAFRHEAYGTMIKQVRAVSPEKNEIHVTGTQENSIDSRQFGPITTDAVLGKVIWHIRKPAA